MEECCGVHLDPGDIGSRTKVRLVVVEGGGAVPGVDQLHCTSHHQHNSQAEHLVISDNSGNTEMVDGGMWVLGLGVRLGKNVNISKSQR